MVKAILFDFWGTLVEHGIWSPVKQVKNVLEIDLPFSEYITRMEKVFMTREFSSLKDAFEELCREFDVPSEEKKVEELIGLWNKAWMLAQPYQEVEEVLKRLKENYKLVLVCNTDNFSIPQVLDKFKMPDLFDEIFFSFKLGSIKTDKKFFQTILNELNILPDECLLVGDSIQSDIIPAKALGIKTVLIDRKDKRSFQPKIKKLDGLEKTI